MNTTLLFLAAGLGSRYGGLKQLEGFGPHGETLMEYSVYDGIRAGFDKIIFVISDSFENEFRERLINKIKLPVELDYVFQEMTDIPPEFNLPAGRKKPWGTGHAVLAARKKINEPFAVLNADDFYGSEAFELMHGFLNQLNRKTRYSTAVVGYPLKNTLSDFGAVSRGVIERDAGYNLRQITENKSIFRDAQNRIVSIENGRQKVISEHTLVSMNLMGFTPKIFAYLESHFYQFIKQYINNVKTEFDLPTVLNALLHSGKVRAKVIKTQSQWFGVTYAGDKFRVLKKIKALVEQGRYPEQLWK